MPTLALDLAASMGWAHSDGRSGVVKLGNREERPYALYIWLMKVTHGNEDIVCERVAGQHKNAIISMAELHGIVRLFCRTWRHSYSLRSPGEIKKHATGKGNAKKDAMVDAARLRWPDKGIVSNDEADALWLLDLEMSQQDA